jgi:hypothetical protein
MIVKGFRRNRAQQEAETTGFDAFDLRLGDLMRGERATLGKSLLDVQRELKIKAAYIAAIENADPTAFDTPGFIAGYVRSYARYLKMDPDWAFDTFCGESGFATAHGMSAEASAAKPSILQKRPIKGHDIFSSSATPFVPEGDALFSRIEPGAVGSVFVLAALIGGIGYGGWTVLQEVQRVQFAPVEQAPTVVSDIDPLAGGANIAPETGQVASFSAPSVEAFDRLYRPQAFGAIVPETSFEQAVADAAGLIGGAPIAVSGVQVLETPAPGVQMIAVRPAWVRVKAADGTTIFEATMKAGDTFTVPQTENPATLRVGASGAIYFAINGIHYGPAGPRGQVTSNLAMSVDNLTASFTVADLTADSDLADIVRVAELAPAAQ